MSDSHPVYELAQSAVLKQGGWWTDAVERGLESVLVENTGGLERTTLVGNASKRLGSDDALFIDRRLGSLIETARVLEHEGILILAENRRVALGREMNEQAGIARSVEQRYERARAEVASGASVLPGWHEFNSEILAPIVADLGARTMNLMTGKATVVDTRAYEKYSGRLTQDARSLLRILSLKFFDPSDPDVRSFVMNELGNYFLTASGFLSKKTLEAISDASTRKPEFRLILDTNAVFSILDLHENPANEASRSLIALGNRIRDHAVVDFFVLQETLEEAKEALKGAKMAAPISTLTAEQARALRSTGNVSGLMERYIAAAENSPMTASTYFDERIRYLDSLIEDKGVTIIREDLESLKETSGFRAAVSDWLSFQQGRSTPRTRTAIVHDVLALSYVENHRQSRCDVMVDAVWWFLTVDIHLRRHEEKNIAGNSRLPCSIMPDELSQVLRFWVPRSEELEQALLGGIRLPFSFYDYDNKSQKTSIDILNKLSAMSFSDELSETATRKILVDQNVRQVFEVADSTKEQRETVIESRALELVADAERALEDARTESAALRTGVAERKRRSEREEKIASGQVTSKARLLGQRDRALTELKKLNETLVKERRQQTEVVGGLRGELGQVSLDLDSLREQMLKRGEAYKRGVSSALALAEILLIGSGVLYLLTLRGSTNGWRLALVILVSFQMGLLSLPAISDRVGASKDWRVRQLCLRYRFQSVLILVGGVVGAIVQFAVLEPV